MPEDYSRIREVLFQNRDKPFVRRILNPAIYPNLDNGDGSISTHSMAAEVGEDGKWYVFPTVQMTKDGLKRFPLRDAMVRAYITGDHIRFDDKDEAIGFSENYKAASWKNARPEPLFKLGL